MNLKLQDGGLGELSKKHAVITQFLTVKQNN